MTIAITGATGQLGRLALAAVQARAPEATIVALARNPAADLGVPVRAFDYTKAETLAPALAGIKTLVLISSNDFNDRAGQHRAVIDACAAHDVVIEINANPWRLDLDWRWVNYAMEKGVKLSINTDAHEMEGYADM